MTQFPTDAGRLEWGTSRFARQPPYLSSVEGHGALVLGRCRGVVGFSAALVLYLTLHSGAES